MTYLDLTALAQSPVWGHVEPGWGQQESHFIDSSLLLTEQCSWSSLSRVNPPLCLGGIAICRKLNGCDWNIFSDLHLGHLPSMVQNSLFTPPMPLWDWRQTWKSKLSSSSRERTRSRASRNSAASCWEPSLNFRSVLLATHLVNWKKLGFLFFEYASTTYVDMITDQPLKLPLVILNIVNGLLAGASHLRELRIFGHYEPFTLPPIEGFSALTL